METDDWFGYAVALSADGRKLAVGAIWNMNVNGEANAGQARVFERRWYPRTWEENPETAEERWIQLGTELEGDSALGGSSWGASFGAHVGLSDNGTVLTAASSTGARIYQFDDDDKPYYYQIGKDFVPQGKVSLTLSPDGNAVGVSSDSGNITVFLREHDEWKHIDSFDVNDIDTTATDGSYVTMALLGDGSLVAISNAMGLFRTFQLSGTEYVQLGQDLIFNATSPHGDENVCFSANGRFLAIKQFGSVHVFVLDGDEWSPIGGNDLDSGNVYGSIAFSADGSVLAVGARVFRLSEDLEYQQFGQDLPSKGQGEAFGHAVSLSADGSLVAVGGPSDDGSRSDMGYVRVFELQK